MRLIGMSDSPYVRRVAVSLKLMGLPFEHDQVSVFRHFDKFAAINPVVKAPTLILDDGLVLMESSLILDYLERIAPPGSSLVPGDPAAFARTQRLVGLALVACDKTVQVVYEHELRPSEKLHQPWLDRVIGQLRAAYRLLDAELPADGWVGGDRPAQGDVSAAVAWRFTHFMRPGLVDEAGYPALAALSRRAEALPAFASTPLD
jgi:glutathione S-transferase